jgi:hypothetical protein
MRVLFILGLLVLAGCESNPFKPDRSNEVSSSGGSSKLICTNERAVGTYISKRRCRTRAQIEQEQEDAQRAINTIRDRPSVMGTP